MSKKQLRTTVDTSTKTAKSSNLSARLVAIRDLNATKIEHTNLVTAAPTTRPSAMEDTWTRGNSESESISEDTWLRPAPISDAISTISQFAAGDTWTRDVGEGEDAPSASGLSAALSPEDAV